MYDGDRLVRSVTVREREYTDDDLVALVESARQAPRGSHGWPVDEAMSADGDPADWGAKYRWHVPPPAVDFAQKALDQAQDAYRKQYPDADLGALRWRVEKIKR